MITTAIRHAHELHQYQLASSTWQRMDAMASPLGGLLYGLNDGGMWWHEVANGVMTSNAADPVRTSGFTQTEPAAVAALCDRDTSVAEQIVHIAAAEVGTTDSTYAANRYIRWNTGWNGSTMSDTAWRAMFLSNITNLRTNTTALQEAWVPTWVTEDPNGGTVRTGALSTPASTLPAGYRRRLPRGPIHQQRELHDGILAPELRLPQSTPQGLGRRALRWLCHDGKSPMTQSSRVMQSGYLEVLQVPLGLARNVRARRPDPCTDAVRPQTLPPDSAMSGR